MARPKSRPKTNRYSIEFKLSAVKLSQLEGIQVKDVAEALDIHPFMLSRWRKEAREGRLRGKVSIRDVKRPSRELAQLGALKRRYALLEQEHALLKKAIRFCSDRRPRSSHSSKRSGTVSE